MLGVPWLQSSFLVNSHSNERKPRPWGNLKSGLAPYRAQRQLGFIGRAWQCELELYAARSLRWNHSGSLVYPEFGGLQVERQTTCAGKNVRFSCNDRCN